jgi:hypothetical protein
VFPLGIDFIGKMGRFSPDTIPILDKAKYRVTIDVIRKRKAIAKPDCFESLDMIPAGFP